MRASRARPESLRRAAALLALIASVGIARAEPGPRDFCPDRPGLGTPACTMDKGRVALELGIAGWEHDRGGGSRADTVTAGEGLVRIGLADRLEAQIGWTAYGHARVRAPSGAVSRTGGTGDVIVALRRNLRNPDGSGTAIAFMPYATLPVGSAPLGAGDWGAGLRVPMSVELPEGFSFALTPQIDAAVDGDGRGRHLAFGGVAGLGLGVGDVSGGVEFSLMRDDDPAGRATLALAGLSLAWQAGDDLQFDAGVNLGLDGDSPDAAFYLGIARRF